MELDTGAAVSIISDATRKALFLDKKVHKSLGILNAIRKTLPAHIGS